MLYNRLIFNVLPLIAGIGFSNGKFVLTTFPNGETVFTGTLPTSPARLGGVEGSYIIMTEILTGKPRPLGRGDSLFARNQNAIYSGLFWRTDRFVFSQTIGEVIHAESRLL